MSAFNGDGLKLRWFKLDIFTLGDLVAFDDLATIHLIAGFSIDLSVADAMAGLFVELVEADLPPLGSSWARGSDEPLPQTNSAKKEPPIPTSQPADESRKCLRRVWD
jgi:hypothetical protein